MQTSNQYPKIGRPDIGDGQRQVSAFNNRDRQVGWRVYFSKSNSNQSDWPIYRKHTDFRKYVIASSFRNLARSSHVSTNLVDFGHSNTFWLFSSTPSPTDHQPTPTDIQLVWTDLSYWLVVGLDFEDLKWSSWFWVGHKPDPDQLVERPSRGLKIYL